MRTGKVATVIAYIVATLISFFFVGPILGIFLMSIKPSAIVTLPILFFTPSAEHYASLFFHAVGAGGVVSTRFGPSMLNSAIIASVTTLLVVVMAAMSSFAFSRFRFRGRFGMGVYIFICYSVPAIAFLYPMFFWVNNAGLYDSYLGAVFISTTLQLPWTLWMLKSFFDSIPKDLEESGMVDGCSRFGAFTRIILPLSAPGLAVVSIFTFLFVWNSFLPLLIITGGNTKPVSVFLAEYRTQYGVQWGPMAAGSIVSIIPTVIMALLIQKYIVAGLTLGAVKG